jgi:hypothetical protein
MNSQLETIARAIVLFRQQAEEQANGADVHHKSGVRAAAP